MTTRQRSAVIRPAAEHDMPAIAEIYNQGIEDRSATFETRLREPEEVAGWLGDGLPLIVAADDDGRVMGFACAAPYSDRCVYAGVAEHGVYVARDARGHGIGRRLLEHLARACASVGLYKLTSRVFAENAASRAVHRAAGFREVGIQRRHGRLDGEWKDCVLVERLIGEAAAHDEPEAPL
jgi:L-amino acid N-acyltransferase YncA